MQRQALEAYPGDAANRAQSNAGSLKSSGHLECDRGLFYTSDVRAVPHGKLDRSQEECEGVTFACGYCLQLLEVLCSVLHMSRSVFLCSQAAEITFSVPELILCSGHSLLATKLFE